MSHIKPSNGANVFIADRFPHSGNCYHHHVLAQFNGQWVTWVFNEIDNSCHYGHYFDKVTDALDDYSMRLAWINRKHTQELAEIAAHRWNHIFSGPGTGRSSRRARGGTMTTNQPYT